MNFVEHEAYQFSIRWLQNVARLNFSRLNKKISRRFQSISSSTEEVQSYGCDCMNKNIIEIFIKFDMTEMAMNFLKRGLSFSVIKF